MKQFNKNLQNTQVFPPPLIKNSIGENFQNIKFHQEKIKKQEYINNSITYKPITKFENSNTKKFGYKNKDGTILAEGFDWCSEFKYGIGIYSLKNGLKGWINEEGKIIAKGFRSCHTFIEEIARFQKKDNTMGWINKDGIILAEGFKYCGDFSEGKGLFIKENGVYGWINEDGTIWKEGFKLCYDFKSGEAIFTNKKGKDLKIINHLGEIRKFGTDIEYFINNWGENKEYINIYYYLYFNSNIKKLIIEKLKKTTEEIEDYQKQYLLHRHEMYPEIYKTPITPRELLQECQFYEIKI